jgi:hypothetical protein
MPKNLVCRRCGGQFRSIRIGHIFCSDTCRKLAFKAKKNKASRKRVSTRLEAKIKALSSSVFGRYLHRELVRAGTVQVLSGHTYDSLTELVALRRRCTSYGGYEKGMPLAEYELSHIYPVSGKAKIGLLHPLNLVICPRTFNRKHARSTPVSGTHGLFIERSTLLKKWQVSKATSISKSMNLARLFLGDEFDKWLKGHQISVSQSKTLARKLLSNGLFTQEFLNGMSLQQLQELADASEIPYFSMDKGASDLDWVLATETQRLMPDNHLSKAIQKLREIDESFDDVDTVPFGGADRFSQFKGFLLSNSLLALHGLHYESSWMGKHVSDYTIRSSRYIRVDRERGEGLDDDVL